MNMCMSKVRVGRRGRRGTGGQMEGGRHKHFGAPRHLPFPHLHAPVPA